MNDSRDAVITVNEDGTQTWVFVHVDDVVQANVRAATRDGSGLNYHVGTVDAVTVRRLAELVRDMADADLDIVTPTP